MRIQKLSLGLTQGEKQASIAKLAEVMASLIQVLSRNLQIYWLTRGKSIGVLYQRKLDLTWIQVKDLGVRIAGLTAMREGGREKNADFFLRETTLQALIIEDLRQEDKLCAQIREHLTKLHGDKDWSSMYLLQSILAQREELVHELETILDDPILEYIWEDEKMRMGKKDGGQDLSMH